MSKPAFTPGWTDGPWEVALIKGSYKRPALIMAGDKVVASCVGNQLEPDATSIREATANAYLLVASKELYAAGEKLADAASAIHPTAPSAAEMDRLHIAIADWGRIAAKARGEKESES